MKLRAKIFKTGATLHAIAELRNGNAIPIHRLPDPEFIEIVPDANGFLLLRLDSSGNCLADTWHETISLAKNQAQHEFGIADAEWEQVE